MFYEFLILVGYAVIIMAFNVTLYLILSAVSSTSSRLHDALDRRRDRIISNSFRGAQGLILITTCHLMN
jgi:hypothetical protein